MSLSLNSMSTFLWQFHKREGKKKEIGKELRIIIKIKPKINTDEILAIKHQAQFMLNSLEQSDR